MTVLLWQHKVLQRRGETAYERINKKTRKNETVALLILHMASPI